MCTHETTTGLGQDKNHSHYYCISVLATMLQKQSGSSLSFYASVRGHFVQPYPYIPPHLPGNPMFCRRDNCCIFRCVFSQFGYRSTPEIMDFLKETLELRNSLSAAAHLIHGSSEGRFTITYCPAGLSREEVEGGGSFGK